VGVNREAKQDQELKMKIQKDEAQPLSAWWGRSALIAWIVLAVAGAISLVAHSISDPLPFSLKKDWFPKVDSLGVFGDAFGVVTSLVSLLTLFVAMRLYELQRDELEKTTKALNDQYRESARSRTEDRINEAIEDYRAQLDSIVIPARGAKVTEMWRGRDALFHVWSKSMFGHMLKHEQILPTYDGSVPNSLVTILSPALRLYKSNQHLLAFVLKDPKWIEFHVHDRLQILGKDTTQDVVIATSMIEQWKQVLLIHKYQIEPLVTTLCEAVSRIVSINNNAALWKGFAKTDTMDLVFLLKHGEHNVWNTQASIHARVPR
jgi:hypothetical protein